MTLTLKSFLGVLFLSVFFSANTSIAQTQNIFTIAGNGSNSYCGSGLPGEQACVQAYDVAISPNEYAYISGGNAIRLLTYAGIMTTVSGGTTGTAGDGGNMAFAEMLDVRGMCIAPQGHVYVCDGNRVRKIDAFTNIITTVAGSLAAGFGGDNGAATSALLNMPTDVAIDAAGNLYISDRNNQRIRKVTPAGIITTVAGTGVAGYTDGIGGLLNGPQSLAVDASGNILIADENNNRIRKLTPAGVLSTIVNVLGIPAYGGDTGPAELAQCTHPKGVAVDLSGNIYFSADNRVRVVRPNGKVYTMAGNGTAGFSGDFGSATAASLNNPRGITVGPDDGAYENNLLIVDFNNYRVRKMYGCSVPPNLMSGITGPVVVCPGGTYTYSITPALFTTYHEWTIPQGWVINGSAVGSTISVTTSASSGNITVKGVNMCGETSSAPLAVSTVGSSSPISPAGPFVTICQDISGNGSVNLSVNVPPDQSIVWSINSTPLPWETNPTYTATTVGTYEAILTHNTLGCSGSAGSVQVEYLGAVATAGQFYVCAGDTIILEGFSTSQAPATLQWQFNGVDMPGATNDTFYAVETGDYTLVATANCSIESWPVHLDFFDTPTVSITPSGPFEICFGSGVQIQANTTEPNCEWQLDGVGVGYTTSYTATQPGNYTVIVGGSGSCAGTTSFTVTADTAQAIVSASGPTVFCVGDEVVLNANTGTGFTYQWRKNGTNIPGATGITYSAMTSGNYTAIVDEGLCTDTSAFIAVTVDTPQASITAGGPTTICEGEDVLLEANTGLGFSYQWMLNGNYLGGSVTSAYTADESGIFSVIVDEGQCSDTAEVTVIVNPPPTPTITQSGSDLSVPSGFISYQWYLNGNAISGANSETYTATQDGDYYVVVSDGCEGQSNTVNLFLSLGDMNAGGSSIVIRPNPFSDFAVLTFDNTQRLAHSFKLYNVQGQLVQDLKGITTGELKIERGVLSAGMYYFQLHNDKGVVGKGKLIIQ